MDGCSCGFSDAERVHYDKTFHLESFFLSLVEFQKGKTERDTPNMARLQVLSRVG